MSDDVAPDAPATAEPATDAGRMFTTDEVNALVRDRLRRKDEGIARDYGDLAALRAKAEKFDALEAEQMSASEKQAARIAELEAAAAAAEAKTVQAEVALLVRDKLAAAGLDARWAARVRGTTAEEIDADVAELVEALKPSAAGEIPANRGTTSGGGISRDEASALSMSEYAKARREGLIR